MKWEHKLTPKHWGKNSYLYSIPHWPILITGKVVSLSDCSAWRWYSSCRVCNPLQYKGHVWNSAAHMWPGFWASWSQVKVRERHFPGPSVETPALLRSWVQAQGKEQTDPYCRTRARVTGGKACVLTHSVTLWTQRMREYILTFLYNIRWDKGQPRLWLTD